MESSKKIIKWSLDNHSKLSLKVEYYSAINKIIPNKFDIGLYIKIQGSQYYGRGTDTVEEIAYCKALSEAIERSSLKVYNIQNTNGLAVHPDLVSAKLIGRNELLERDAFFCHYLMGVGFQKIIFKNSITEYFENLGIIINFYKMCSYQYGLGVLCSAHGGNFKLPFGNVTGSAFGQEQYLICEKSLEEVARVLCDFSVKEKICSMDINKFNSLKKFSFGNHGDLALDLDYSREFEKLLSNKPYVIKSEISMDTFEYVILDTKLYPVEDLPLNIVKVRSAHLQDIYVGKTDLKKINYERLIAIYGQDMVRNNINMVPHPFD